MNATQRQHQYSTTTTTSGRRDSGIFLASDGYGRAANETEETADREELSGIRRIPLSEAPALGAREHVPADVLQADEEQALVASLVENDPAAWKEFRRRYDRLILRCITKVTKRFAAVSQDDVREIYAQLLVSLLANGRSKLRAFDPARGSRFSSYIGMLAIHCTYDWLRAVRREPPRETLNEAFELSSDLPDPFEATAALERAALAERVMAGFSERDRTFAALYFGEGMEPHEIARSMKISVKTVYSKKHKIQSKLESIVAAIKGHAA